MNVQASRALRPDEIGAQAGVHGAAVIGPRGPRFRVVERVVRGRQPGRVVTHQVGHDHSNALLRVVEHDGRAALRAGAQFQRPVGVLGIEGLPIEPFEVVRLEVAVIEEHHVGGILPGDALAHRTMTDVVVNRVVIRFGMDVVTAA